MSVDRKLIPVPPPADLPIFPLALSPDRYEWLVREGFLTENDPVELIEGYLVAKMPQNEPHAVGISKGSTRFIRLLPDGWTYRSQLPIRLEDGLPEPDGAVARGEPEHYLAGHPRPDQLALVVEVADTTLNYDRTVKLRSYARAGITHYWIVNLIDRRVEVYMNPSGPTDEPAVTPSYGERVDVGAEGVVPLVLDGAVVAEVRVADLLP